MTIGTKNYFTNTSTHVARSQPMFNDLGYSLDIPWSSVYTAGWQEQKPSHADGPVWGQNEHLLRGQIRNIMQLVTSFAQT